MFRALADGLAADHLKPAKVQGRKDRKRRHPNEKAPHPTDKRAPQMHRRRKARGIIKQGRAGCGQAGHHFEIGVQKGGVAHGLPKGKGQQERHERKEQRQRDQMRQGKVARARLIGRQAQHHRKEQKQRAGIEKRAGRVVVAD